MSDRRTADRRSFWDVFAWPTVLAVLTAVGLLSALFGDGVWDALSWGTLSLPIAVIAYFAAKAA